VAEGDSGAAGASAKLRYRRVLLKLSGEAVGGSSGRALDTGALRALASLLRDVQSLGVQLSIVIGGGNIIRGITSGSNGLTRTVADYMGMMATMINALALEDCLDRMGAQARLLSPIGGPQLAEPYVPRRAKRHMEEGRIVILGAGTGNPFFSTDTAAALRALELGAEVLLKATKVDGIYSADPLKDPKATRFDQLTYLSFLEKGLRVMDSTAVSLCMEHRLPIIVFDLNMPQGLRRVLEGDPVGTRIGEA
jgi:uridylate kinase